MPVVGSFNGNIDTFYWKDTYKVKATVVAFVWNKPDPE